MAMYCFSHCFLYSRTECIMKYGAVRKFYRTWPIKLFRRLKLNEISCTFRYSLVLKGTVTPPLCVCELGGGGVGERVKRDILESKEWFFTCDCILRALITFKIFMVVYSSYFFTWALINKLFPLYTTNKN